MVTLKSLMINSILVPIFFVLQRVSIIHFLVQELILELNEVLAEENIEEEGQWKKNLKEKTLKCFEFFSQNIQGSYHIY
ncbi:putative diphosphate--fructose-6-phosphate 1-phosphotransferase [Arabidopsis thaliana]